MLSKKWHSLIKSLQIKKYRTIHQSFLAEGAKSVQELLNSDFEIQIIFGTEDFYRKNQNLLNKIQFEEVTEAELAKSGTFESNNACIAVATTKENMFLGVSGNEFVLVLDEIKDPGNLGTILRIADWYGIQKVVCSDETVDFYNPKVIAASMGSFTRVQTYYCNLEEYLKAVDNQPVYGAMLSGTNVHQTNFPDAGYLIMGNESKGISEKILPFITHQISIPRFGNAESLNVAIATAVILDNLKRS
jgi:TrmH family RNA methyltransferase